MKFLNEQPLLFVVSAPSGAGKTTVCNALLQRFPQLHRAVTCTTRPPRTGEVHGKDYYFLAKEEFDTRKNAGDFVEWANVYGNYYGTLKSEITDLLRQGKDIIVSVDVQGVLSIKKLSQTDALIRQSLVTMFIALPDPESFRMRLGKRGTDSAEVIQRRVDTATKEMETMGEFDYVLLSGTMEEDADRAASIFLAEKMKTGRSDAEEIARFLEKFKKH